MVIVIIRVEEDGLIRLETIGQFLVVNKNLYSIDTTISDQALQTLRRWMDL